VIIDPVPVIGAANTSPACVGDIIKFSASGGSIYNWTGPNGFTANTDTVRISNAQLTDAGIYNIVVQTKGGCSKQDATTVIVNPLPLADAGAFTQICAGTSTVLQASGGNNYSWSPILGLSNPGISNPIASPLNTTTYTVIVSNQFHCKASDTVTVIVLKIPLAFAGPDKKILEGQQVQLDGSTGGDVASYFWTPAQFMNNPALLTPTVSPTSDITYTPHVQSGNGCGMSTDDVFVRVFKKIDIPNAFSPNGDGINDVWNINALASYPESTVKVFNRYGQIIYQSNGYSKPWDGSFNGSPLPFGTYYYIIDRKNGFPLSTGWVAIIR
jgi:gliding motility-associated-like protein